MSPAVKPSDVRVAALGYGGAFNMGNKHLEEVEKAGMVPTAVVRFENGVHMIVRISIVESNPRPGRIEVTGTKKSHIFDGTTRELVKPKKSSTVTETGTNPENEHQRYYRNIADHLVSPEPLVIDAYPARRPIHILDLAVRSAKQGKSLRAKYR